MKKSIILLSIIMSFSSCLVTNAGTRYQNRNLTKFQFKKYKKGVDGMARRGRLTKDGRNAYLNRYD